MSVLSAREVQAVAELADVLYEFLPGTPHPRADERLSFPGAARVAAVSAFWTGGSKRPAIAQLLRSTLEQRRGSFCPLIVAVVTNALIYRRKKNPLTRAEIDALNEAVAAIGLKIPDLYEAAFLDSLVGTTPKADAPETARAVKTLAEVKAQFLSIAVLTPQQRGFAFEGLLTELFYAFSLAPRSAFRLVGEQIDGSFDLSGVTYLVEAKWENARIGVADLFTFAGKVQSKLAGRAAYSSAIRDLPMTGWKLSSAVRQPASCALTARISGTCLTAPSTYER